MPATNFRFSSSSSSSSSSFSSSSSSSQFSTPRTFQNGFLQNLMSPRLSSQSKAPVKKSPLWDSEKANSHDSHSTPLKHTPTPKSPEELRTEIEFLEFEILHLERYLLSIYRTTFEDHLPSLSPEASRRNSQFEKTPPPSGPLANRTSFKSEPYTMKFHKNRASSVSSDSSVSCRRSLSSSFKPSSKMDKIKRTESGHRSLADLLGVSHMIEDLNSPNKLSEEIVRRMCLIYSKLLDKTESNLCEHSKNLCDGWSQKFGEMITAEPVVVHKLCLDEDNFKCVESMLKNFRSLVQNLEKVDPQRMTREGKLAFWINIHNALLMHAYIAYGTSERKRGTSVMKVAYNIGGKCVNAYHIQSSILGICPRHSARRLQTLFSPARKSMTCSSSHIYALDYCEPLVHFALSTGTSTDPMVRIYTTKGIFQELRQARDEFIRTNVLFEDEKKILLPKILYHYAKDASLDMVGLLEAIVGSLPDTERRVMRRCVKLRQEKCVQWLSQDSSFWYVIHGGVTRGRTAI